MTDQSPAPAVKRGRGRPRFADTRVVVGLPSDLVADLDAEANARGTTRSDEIRRRLNAFTRATKETP